MTQRDRILRALERGTVNPVHFQAPTCDGGKPILRVAARMAELRAEGFQIASERTENGTSDYWLATAALFNAEAFAA